MVPLKQWHKWVEQNQAYNTPYDPNIGNASKLLIVVLEIVDIIIYNTNVYIADSFSTETAVAEYCNYKSINQSISVKSLLMKLYYFAYVVYNYN